MAEQESKRKLAAAKREAQEKAQEMVKKKAKEATQKVVKKAASKLTLRLVSGAAAASIVGLIISYIIMTIQFFIGNLLESKLVPKLSLVEILIWGCLSLLIFAAIVAVALILQLLADPWQSSIVALNAALDWVKRFWPDF
ncbi:hypothetical protein HOB10_01215 [Candidatus Parcubacteria bacterium]|jgi:hypothetical protein|nr:hypothetical protein [Candidatus Parcubacteria bacterium]